MSTLIFYNGNQVASGQPVPLVGKNEQVIRYGSRWGLRTNITLQGNLTGCTFSDFVHAQSGILNDFSQDFQSFQIVQDSEVVFEMPYGWVTSINFGDSKYVGAVPYTVAIECYEQDYFSGTFGVLDPSHDWSFDEQRDGRVKVTHNISARGFNTSSGVSNALDNAKNFVLGLTGWSSGIYPVFITGTFNTPCLQQFSEKIDRLNGSYSVVETYIYDQYSNDCTVLRYETDYQCTTTEARATMSVRGQVEGGFYSSIESLRARYSGFNIVAVATGETPTINPFYLTSGVSEDPIGHKLSFDVTFDNLPTNSSGCYFDYSTNVEVNDEALTTVTLNGTVHGRGSLLTRWQYVQAYFATLNFFNYVEAAFSGFGGTVALNPFPISSGSSYNSFLGDLGVSLTYNNRPTPSDLNFSEIDYTYEFVDAVQKVGAMPLLYDICSGDQYALTDLGYANRAEFTLKGTARPICGLTAVGALSYLKTDINAIMEQEISGANRIVLEKQEFTTKNVSEGELIDFLVSWTFEAPVQATSAPDYSQIISLGVI